MAKQDITDEQLAQALGIYVGLVDRVLRDPQRWLGTDDDPPTEGSLPGRLVEAARRRTLGSVTPGSDDWAARPLAERTGWWVSRIGLSAGLAAAAPRFAGALADRVPLQAALGASAAGLAVCAVAREHGVTEPSAWVPLLASVVLDRQLPPAAAVPDPETSEQDLATAADDPTEPPSGTASLGQAAQRTVRTLWRLGRTFFELQELLDRRPRGGLLARVVAKVPVVGVAGGWLDERGAIRKAAKATERLLAARP